MKQKDVVLKLLFIINPRSGSGKEDFSKIIPEYFSSKQHTFQIYELPLNCLPKDLKIVIDASKSDRVIAVGGDGTLKMVASCLLKTETPIGIIPAGSANGMAKELGIPTTAKEALDVVVNGSFKKIHAVLINGELCIHLADIGFNAYIVKKFDDLPRRGMLGYAKAAWYALWSRNIMNVTLSIGKETISADAAMIVIANATMYGTGIKINPEGKLDDDVFEVILVKKYSFMEILKLRFTHLSFDPETIEIFKTDTLKIKTKHHVHFQVDGEYIGKVNQIEARIINDAINVIA